MKRALIIVLILSVLLVSGCASTAELMETGREDACTSNADCRCRNFDGSDFTEGFTRSVCADDGYCTPCLYH